MITAVVYAALVLLEGMAVSIESLLLIAGLAALAVGFHALARLAGYDGPV